MTLELVPWRGANVPVLNGHAEVSRLSQQEYLTWYNDPRWMGPPMPFTSYGSRPAEPISATFEGFVQGMLYADGPVASAEAYRLRVFGQAPLLYQEIVDGRPGDFFDDAALDRLRSPWPGATLSDLMKRALLYGDFAGNAFIVDIDDELVLVRPDWVEIVLAKREFRGGQVGWKQIGIVYYEGGPRLGDGVSFLPGEYAHFVPGLPDPLATYRGMSWLTPLVREVQADKAATDHKLAFFEHAASPNLAVSLPKEITPTQFEEFVDKMDAKHKGAANAYKTLYTAGGADVTVIGANMQQMDFSAVQGKGEPLALDTPVPTPTGWTTMGEIAPGDQVIASNGLPANVVAVGPVHHGRTCYRVTLKDRTSIVADATHLWAAADRQSARREMRTYTTSQLRNGMQENRPNGAGAHRFAVPPTPVADLSDVDLLVDPYVLGAWLGDGHTAGAAICGATEDLKYIAAEIESRGYVTTAWSTADDKVDVIGVPGGLLAGLRALGVLGNKQIPQVYLRSSVAQRLDLLRGLMDTDGTVDNVGRGQCAFNSKFEHLARQVTELLRSLGYRATLSSRPDARSRTGLMWVIRFRVAADRIPFLLPRKVDRCLEAGDQFYSNRRSIVSIEPVESVPVRCIMVDTEDHLFLAGEGFVPTHNTRVANAAGVPPVLLSFSEGMQGSSLNAGNYTAAKRNFVDTTERDLWQNWSGSLQQMEAFTPPKPSTRLWYDGRDIPFLHEDALDAANIQQTLATTITQLVREGFEPESVKSAVMRQDMSLLKHTGLTSVQLQPPMPQGVQPAEPVDFGALREPVRAVAYVGDEDDVVRALVDAFDEIERRYNPEQARIPKGFEGGGRFRSLTERLVSLLSDWAKGDGPDDPLDDFDREQLRKTAKALADKARAAGDNDRAARLTPRRGASSDEIKLALYKDVRGSVRGDRGAKDAKPEAGKPVRFTLTGGGGGGDRGPDALAALSNDDHLEMVDALRRASERDQWNKNSDYPISGGLTLPEKALVSAGLAEVISDEHGVNDKSYLRTTPAGVTYLAKHGAPRTAPSGHRYELRPRPGGGYKLWHVTPSGEEFSMRSFAAGDKKRADEIVAALNARENPKSAPASKLRNLDVGVYTENGKVSLWEVSDSGERRRRVALVADLAGLEAWADEHGEIELADWARKERGGTEPAKAPARKATAKPASTKATGPAKKTATPKGDVVPPAATAVVKPPSGARFAVLPKAERGESGDGRLTPDAPWGRFGAAGVLIRAAGDDGEPRYLLVKAGKRSDTPGRWLLPGGALDELESPYQGVAREIGEELGVGDAQLAGLHPVGEHVADHPSGWTYTSLTATSPTMFDAHADGVEIAEAGWFTADELREMTAQAGKTPARGEIHERLAGALPGLTASYRDVDAAEAEAKPRVEAARVASGDLVLGLNIAANHQQTHGTKDPAALRRALDELTATSGSAVAGLTPDEIARQQVVADALGDLSKLDTPAKLDRKVRAELKKRGVTLDGQMGAFVPFDRHTMDGPADVSAGTPVRITQPSMTYTDPKTKTRTLLSRAQVAAMADPTTARADLDDKLDDLGRRIPTDTTIIDRAAQALANGDDRKQVALQMRRAANADKDMSAEDRRTHELLAGEIGKVNRRPIYINDQGNIDVGVFVTTDAGRVDLSELEDMEIRPWAEGRAHTYDRNKAKRWGQRYEWVRHELTTGKITRAKAVKLLREQVDIVDQEVKRLERKKKDWSASHDRSPWALQHLKPSAAEEAALKSGPVAAAAYRDLADKLAAAKIPARPRVGSAPPIELGGVLPLDESTFRYVPLHQAVVSRGQALDPEFKHRGTGPTGGVTYLFGSGFKRPKRAGLTDAENDAVDRYTVGRVARDLNGSLRQGRAVHGVSSHPEIGLADIDLDVMRTDLDAAIANSQLTRDATLWRGVLLKKADRDRLVPGAVFSDAGYSSTAVSDRGAKKVIDAWRAAGLYKGTTPALYRILARAGTNGAVGHEQAYEVVLPRDQKYRVIREELDTDGKTPVFVLEAVPAESGAFTRGRDVLATFDYDSLPKPSGGFYDHDSHKKTIQRRISEQQGYDGKPTVVTGQELDKAIKRRGAIEVFRGIKDPYDNDTVTAADYAEQFRSGELHFGNGGTMYGAGTYATTQKSEAQSYAGGAGRSRGAVLRMALRRDARVISHDDVRKLHLKAMPKALRDIDQQREAELATINTSDAAAVKRIVDKYDALRAKMSGRSQAIADLGNFATLLGYDAIVVQHDRKKVGGHSYYVILNRTALLVEDTDTRHDT